MKKISILCVLMITCGNAIAAKGEKWENYKTYWDRIDYSNYDITNYNESKLLTLAQTDLEFSTQGLAFQAAHFVSGNNNLLFAADNYGTIETFAYNCSDDFNHPDKQYWNIYDGAIINWIDGGWRTAKANKGLLFYDNHFSESDAPPPGETCINDSFVTVLSGQPNTRKYFRKTDGREASINNQLYSVYVGKPSEVCITYRCAPGYRMMADPTDEYTRPENGVWCMAENKQCPFYRGGHTYYMKTDEAFGDDNSFKCIESSNNKGVSFGEYQGYTKGQLFLTITGGLIDQMTLNMQNTTCTEDAPHCTVEKLNTACGKLGYPLKGDGTETKVADGTSVLISACEQAQSVFEYNNNQEQYGVRDGVFDNRNCDFMCEYNGISVNVRKKARMDIELSLAKNEQITEFFSCPLFFTDSYNRDDDLTCVYNGAAVDTLVNAINSYLYDTNKKASEAERNNAIQKCASDFCTASGGVYSDGICTCRDKHGDKPCNTEHNGYFYCELTGLKYCEKGVWKAWEGRVPSKKVRDDLVAEWQGNLDNCIAKADNAYNSSINGSSTNADSTNATTDSISDLAGRLAKVEDQFGLSKWRTAEGKFNTARLASDLTAGVVLGTTGALVTSSVVKKKQVKDGFESLECTVGGQHVGDWGDVFRIDGK